MANPVLGIVPPADWIKRTSFILQKSRGAVLMQADAAYGNYFNVRSEDNKQKLHKALEAYLLEQGGHWEKSDRNKRSGGLMKFIYESTRGSALAKNVLEKRIPEARHGALYLWQNADVNAQFAKIVLEGALSIGGSTLGMLQASSYQKGDALKGLGVIAEKTAKGAKTVGDNLATVGKIATGVGKGIVAPKGEAIRETPAPTIWMDGVAADASILTKAKHLLGKLFDKIYDTVKTTVTQMWDDLRLKFARGGFVGTIGGAIGKVVIAIVGKVALHAAPLVSSAIDLGQGVCQAIVAAKTRVMAYMNRRQFVVSPGHPALIAQAIETQMNWSIAKGVYTAAKGGVKLAGNLASLGASALVDVIAACVEFAYKFLTRLAEGMFMRTWIAKVRDLTKNRNEWKADPADGKFRPPVVFNDRAFTALFEAGCSASVCVPMMTLNSGIAGDQLMFMKMFDDTGAITHKDVIQGEFDAGTRYFTQLKEYGRSYLESTGFTFTSTDNVARGLFWHGLNHHHGGRMGTADKVLSFLGGV